MSVGRMQRVLDQLRRAALTPVNGALPDAELLRRFIDQSDETAFTALVRRHATLVLGVCRRVTGDEHDAEDAFQAAFCVLLRKAGSIRRREVLGSWLYGVAYRTALAAKVRRAKTRRRELQVDAMPQPLVMPPEPGQDWQPLLDAALERLPEQYRVPIILCDLDGKSRKDAARQLNLAEGTLSSRLARGRRILAGRLKRQGLALSGGALAAALAQSAAAAQVPATLLRSVAQAGAHVAAGQAPAALAFSAHVLALTEAVMKAMLIGKLKSLTVVLVAAAALTFGGVWLWGRQASASGNTGPVPVSAAEPQTAGARTEPVDSPRGAERLAADDAPEYRVELVALVTDAAGKTKTVVAPAATVAMGQRLPIGISESLAPTQLQPTRDTQYSWNFELVRERGNEILLNVRFEKKDRRTKALVIGRSAEFEDFIAINTWNEISDPTSPGMAFKVKVAPVPLSLGPAMAVPPMRATAAAAESATFTVFRLKHAKAAKAADWLQKVISTRSNLRIISDEQTNSLLVQAEGADRKTVADAIASFDTPAPPPRQAQADANELARELQKFFNQPNAANPPASAISPDGKRLAVSQKNDVFILDTRTGKALARTTGDDMVQALAFSPDGKILATGSAKGKVNLLDVPTGQIVRAILTEHPLVTLGIAFDGQTMMTVLIVTTREPAVRIWDVNTGKLLRVEPKTPEGGGGAKPNPQPNPSPMQSEGKIEKIHADDPSLVQISLGSDQGLKKNDALEVYRLDPPTYLGQIRIVDVTPQQAVGRVERSRANVPPLRVGDRVTTSLNRNP
jgi:RNA polymerase sigma factor (sigma-70 family)